MLWILATPLPISPIFKVPLLFGNAAAMHACNTPPNPVAEPEERDKYGYKSNANARFRIIRLIGSCAKVRQIYLFKGFNNSAADLRVHD